MSARDLLFAQVCANDVHPRSANDTIDAYRDEVRTETLHEAADKLAEQVRERQSEPRWRDGKGDTRGPGALHAIDLLRRMADEAAGGGDR